MLSFKDEKEKKDLMQLINEIGYNYFFLHANVLSDEFCGEDNSTSTMHQLMFVRMMETFSIFLKKIGVNDFVDNHCEENDMYNFYLRHYQNEDFTSCITDSFQYNKKINIDQYLYASNCVDQEPEKIDHTKDTIHNVVNLFTKKSDDNESASQEKTEITN